VPATNPVRCQPFNKHGHWDKNNSHWSTASSALNPASAPIAIPLAFCTYIKTYPADAALLLLKNVPVTPQPLK
jgi:hypothetical protein